MWNKLRSTAPPPLGVTNLEPQATVHSALLVTSILGSAAAIAFAAWLRCFSGMVLYDYNAAVFKEALTPSQATGIHVTVVALMNTALIPLVLVCIFANVTGFLLLRDVRRLQACKRGNPRE